MSRVALFFSISFILLISFCYYPKWQMKSTAATISWDVSGYYMYLPALFIYEDIKGCKFMGEILEKYKPEPPPGFSQAYKHKESGNYVMKYSIGQAITYSPFFAIAHLWASNSSVYEADGFSYPYQTMISMGMLLFAIIGLIFLRKSLLVYFEDKIVALGILGIVLGSNYLNYAAIDGAMTHNTLFTIYTVLIYLSIRFHKNPSIARSIGIGVCVGLAALIRPTELLSCLIPMLWGANIFKREALNKRLQFLSRNSFKLIIAVVVTAAIGFVQLGYWKYATGDWIVYSYQDQGFSWLKPHLLDGIFSYRCGWLVYSPIMVFSIIGLRSLYRSQKDIFPAVFIFSMLFIYITFAWDIWWYGGSLGQRAMVQSYPILAFPLCAFASQVLGWRKQVFKFLIGCLAMIFIYANIWFTHQAHRGGKLRASYMTNAYFWKTLFTYEHNKEDLKLLDTVKKTYEKEQFNTKLILKDTSYNQILNAQKQLSDLVTVSAEKFAHHHDWIRVEVDAFTKEKEWDKWNMTQFSVQVKNGDKMVSNSMYRMQRILDNWKEIRMNLDIRQVKKPFTHIDIKFWNGDGKKEIRLSNLTVETFDE